MAAPQMQRNALAPGLVGAIVLFLSPLFPDGTPATIVRFIVSIFALIVGWFGLQAKQWWWGIVFLAVAVFWNPILPFAVPFAVWSVGAVLGALLFLGAGALIKTERTES